jgi:hypothetical protein
MTESDERAQMELSASPRNPKDKTLSTSSNPLILDVAYLKNNIMSQ